MTLNNYRTIPLPLSSRVFFLFLHLLLVFVIYGFTPAHKKTPDLMKRSGDAVFHPPETSLHPPCHEERTAVITSRAGLLASGSSYSPRLPVLM